MVDFTPVPKSAAAHEFDETFVKDFHEAWKYFQEHPEDYLTGEFSSAQEREDWMKKANAYGKTKPEGIEIVTRRIKYSGSADPESGKLTFIMEPKSIVEARYARIRQERADREQRRQNGEPIRRGHRTRAA